MPADAPLAELRRGGVVESVHRGRYAVCDSGGSVLDSVGDPEATVWVRSSVKPFQALSLVASGAADALDLTDEELAIACGSHGGEAAHLEAVCSMLGKAGLTEDALQSGAHPPLYQPAAEALARAGDIPRPVHGNCSGKHAAMLALCVYRGWDTASYRNPEHPVQREILSAIRGACGLKEGEVMLGGDGCGAPAFAFPLRSLATGFARLSEGCVSAPFGESARRVRCAMREYSFMVAGTDRLDTRLMQGSEIVCKSGAEGVFAAGLPDGKGIAIKVSDGSGRAVSLSVHSLLGRLAGEMPAEPETNVTDLHGTVVGSLESLL